MSPKPPTFQFTVEHQKEKWSAIALRCKRRFEDAQISSASPWTVDQALQPYNRIRNRYTNVLPWDKTRVKLNALDGGSDYINALKLRLGDKTYIATQGPLSSTIHHFWAMCFDQAEKANLDVVVILMVTPLEERGMVKCHRYWPLQDDPSISMGSALKADNLAYDDLEVESLDSKDYEYYTLNTFELRSNGKSKKVLHYYYGKWEDAMPPSRMGPLSALSDELVENRKKYPGIVPIVHCSAGVGRTGTLIAYDHLREEPSFGSYSDPVYETILKMREDRMMMVQTWQQVRFLYDVVEVLAEEKAVNKN